MMPKRVIQSCKSHQCFKLSSNCDEAKTMRNESHLTVHVGGFVDEWGSDKRSDDKLPRIE